MAGRISAHCHLGDIKNAGQKVKKATLITAAYFMPASPVTENVALQGPFREAVMPLRLCYVVFIS